MQPIKMSTKLYYSRAHKCKTKVEVPSNDKHTRLQQNGIHYGHKKFYSTGIWSISQ